ncbi:MAG: hypothetical protein IPO26_18310 [Saprospiraceae bacterium]|nr:hypothetical protein [Saprospiraceae bacterium]
MIFPSTTLGRSSITFIDNQGNRVEQLFDNEGIVLNAATLKSNGKTNPGVEKIDFIKFDKTRITNVLNSKDGCFWVYQYD